MKIILNETLIILSYIWHIIYLPNHFLIGHLLIFLLFYKLIYLLVSTYAPKIGATYSKRFNFIQLL